MYKSETELEEKLIRLVDNLIKFEDKEFVEKAKNDLLLDTIKIYAPDYVHIHLKKLCDSLSDNKK